MHCNGICPENFIPQILHMEMGMINQALDQFTKWVNDVFKVFPLHENEAQRYFTDTKEK
jgi:hypothetical protein